MANRDIGLPNSDCHQCQNIIFTSTDPNTKTQSFQHRELFESRDDHISLQSTYVGILLLHVTEKLKQAFQCY